MNRTTFLLIYSAGIVVVWLSGNPWLRLNYFLLAPAGPVPVWSLTSLLSFLVPFVLVPVAALRGRSINRPHLFWLPLLAILLSASAFAYGWLSPLQNGATPSPSGVLRASSVLPMPFARPVGLSTVYAPLILHFVCCFIGVSQPALKPAEVQASARNSTQDATRKTSRFVGLGVDCLFPTVVSFLIVFGLQAYAELPIRFGLSMQLEILLICAVVYLLLIRRLFKMLWPRWWP